MNQEGNWVAGDMAGRDINKYYVAPTENKYLVELYKKLDEEIKGSAQIRELMEALEHYMSRVPGDNIGLDEKLSKGNRADLLEFARQTKERFSKKLVKFQFYESAQKVYLFVLAEVYTRYMNSVYPLIQSNQPPVVVNKAIQEQIIGPINTMLGQNMLELCSDEINGILYFLTGNCHIKWTK